MKFKTISLGILALAIAGCGTLTNVSGNGQPEGQLVWPNPVTDVTFDNHRGTYGDLHRIDLVRPGVTRDEVYELIGRPQFHEGFHVREWDYVFYFRRDDGTELTCQYKILFDDDYIARNIYWHGEECPPNLAKPEPAPVRHFTFSADALFRFDGGNEDALLPEGRRELDQLVDIARDKSINSIRILGYTDRLGSDAYNLKLSQQRAATVRSYLIMHGIPSSLITARGMGKSNPVVQCHNKNQAALIACLQPNRRVEVEIN